MAAGTPTIYCPNATSTGYKLQHVLRALKSPYSGAGAQREAQWDLATDAAFASIVWTTKLRENDDLTQGDDWVEIPVPMIPLATATTYYLRVKVRNTSNETSSYATAVSFTMETAPLTSTEWAQAQ